MNEIKKEDKTQNLKKAKAIEFIFKITLPLNISETNYITNMLNDNVITFDDIPTDILENYKLNVNERN